jgi:hypothetical protein
MRFFPIVTAVSVSAIGATGGGIFYLMKLQKSKCAKTVSSMEKMVISGTASI